MEDLLKLRKVRDKQDTVLTIIIYDHGKEEFITYLKKQLENIKKIKDSYKRKAINDRLYDFLTFIESNAPEMINYIYLVGPEMHDLELTKKQVNMLKEYNIKSLFYEYSDRYNINYIDKLFNDFDFYKVAEIDKKKITFFDMNSTKIKKLNSETVNNQQELLDFMGKFDLVHGNSTLLKGLVCDKPNFNKRLSPEEIVEEIEKIIIRVNQKKLDELLNNITNPKYEDKIFFGGNETKKYTEQSMVKTLFIHESVYKKFNRIYAEYINFEVVEIRKLEHGDISDRLLNDYNCCVGELYYAI
jgi:hypothetical protein